MPYFLSVLCSVRLPFIPFRLCLISFRVDLIGFGDLTLFWLVPMIFMNAGFVEKWKKP